MSEKANVEEWLAIRKEEGLKIDPDTAEVDWHYAQTLDPYGVDQNLTEECQQIGREYFARSPGSDIWVHFHDLRRRPAMRFGNATNQNWHSLPDWNGCRSKFAGSRMGVEPTRKRITISILQRRALCLCVT
jgi:hypothetical protein